MEKVTVTPWPGGDTPAEADIRQKMADEGLRPYTWSNGPGDVYAAHTHSYHKVIYVVFGSITFGLPALGKKVNLQTGDRLDLAAGVLHDAVVGPEGVVCLEAHAG
jgi:quercetin dioxygenase-like cupin family protein